MRLSLPPQKDDHALGPMDASTTLVEYADFQCPHSKKAHLWVQDLLQNDKDLRFIYRHYPLIDLHTYTVYASLASEAAGLQGKFWEYQNSLLGYEGSLTPLEMLALAEELELNVDQFISAIDSEKLLEKIYRDFSSGLESGVKSTPVFFLNGLRIEGPLKKELLLETIDCWRKGKILPA